MYKVYNTGPRTDPCGIPLIIVTGVAVDCSMQTVCCLLHKYERNQFNATDEML